MTIRDKNAISREESLSVARRLIQEAVDVADKAGIDSSTVLAPHCPETALKDKDGGGGDAETLVWCNVPVRIDNRIEGLFEMPEHNDDLEQKPVFLVTQATTDLVLEDFERYRPSLERMVEDWQEEKSHFMRELGHRNKAAKKSSKRADIKRRK